MLRDSKLMMKTAILGLAALLALSSGGAFAAEITICVPVPTTNVAACGQALTAAAQAAGLADTFKCVAASAAIECTRMVAAGTAQLTKYGGDNLYTSHVEFSLKPAVAETLTPAPGVAATSIPTNTYASVAVVRRDACEKPDISLADFKGKGLCSTGYRRNAGWTLPMGYMLRNGIIPVVAREETIEQDAESVANFFGRICAVGVTNGPARTTGNAPVKWTRMCDGCKNTACADVPADEEYSDYPGALRCLTQGSGDIAFTKHDILFGNVSAWESATVKQADLRLVCPNRPGCQPLDQWANCMFALSATHAFVGQSAWIKSPVGQGVVGFLSGLNTTFINSTRTWDPKFPNMLFTASANGMSKIADPDSFVSHFGQAALDSYDELRSLQVPTARICTISADEKATCDKVVPTMNQVGSGMEFSCVQADGDAGCLQAIQNGQADMRAFDGPDVYRGYEDHNLMAIIAEKSTTGENALGVDYYAVAVVRKSFCDARDGKATLMDLKGKSACSTGYRRNAGWVMPTGALIKAGVMPVVRNDPTIEDDAESWNAFFSGGTCAARVSDNGPRNSEDLKGARWDPLCKNCAGTCTASMDTEPYYDYAGAMRCLFESKGDVAFTKHTVALDFSADGKTPDPTWSKVQSTDLALLCPQGGCAPLSQAYRCHIALATAHAVMVRSSYPDAERLKAALRNVSMDPAFRALVFSGTANPKNHLFKYTTSELLPVNTDRASYLGENLKVFQGLDILNGGGEIPGTAALRAGGPNDPSSGAAGLSAGAIAGIAIGAALGGILLAAGGFVLYVRSRKSRFDEFKQSPASPINSEGAPPHKINF